MPDAGLEGRRPPPIWNMPPLVVRGYGDLRAEVTAVTSGAEHPGEAGRPGRVRLDELARRRGVRPVESVAEMAQDGVFASDGELEEFLAYVQAVRHEDLA